MRGAVTRPKNITGTGIGPKKTVTRPKNITGTGIRPKNITGTGIRPKNITGNRPNFDSSWQIFSCACH
jgi:hypothetical protein